MKKILVLCLCTCFLFQTNSIVANASEGDHNTKIEGQQVITNRETIEKMANEDGVDPDSITKIIINEYELEPIATKKVLQEIPSLKALKATTHINNIKDKGTYYYPSSYWSDSIEGPAKVDTKYSVTGTSKISAGIKIPANVYEANFGVELGLSSTFSKSLNISVPANKVNNIRYYVNYRKKTYDIYYSYSNAPGLWYPQGSGETMIPCGIVVRQYV